MNIRTKSIIIVFFTIVIVVTAYVFPAPAFAADEAVNETTEETVSEVKDPDADSLESMLTEGGEKYAPGWLKNELLGNEVWRYLATFLAILLGLLFRRISDFIFTKRIIPLLKKTPFQFDNLFAEALSKPTGVMIFLIALSGAFAFLSLPTATPDVKSLVYGVIKVLVAATILWFLFRLIDVLIEYLARLAARTDSTLDDQLIPVIRKALKVTIGIVVSIWIIQLLGYSVSSLIAGLGIGGLAVALAFQDTLSNFFGSVVIFSDRPFKVGDMVSIGSVEGVVEEIGFRSTKVRTWPATLISIPNKTVAESTINNLSKRPKRRVLQTVGVTYETNADQMEQVIARILGILESDEGIDQDFKVVRFSDFGASSLDIQVLYFTKALDYADHMAKKEQINLAIMRAIEQLGLSIAFPTHTVYLEGDIAKGLAGMTNNKKVK